MMSAATSKTEDIAEIADQTQFLSFTLGKEIYAIEIMSIREIIDYGNLTNVPMMPKSLRGVINLRGSVVPVVDLSVRFGGTFTEITKRTAIIIVEVTNNNESMSIGVVVDSVNEVLEISQDNIEPSPSFGTKLRTDFIKGMGKVDGKFLILLDVSHVLSVEELSILDNFGEESLNGQEHEIDSIRQAEI